MSALIGGLTRSLAEGRKRVLVRTDSRLASHILTRVNRPRLPRVEEAANHLWRLLTHFQAVAAAWTPGRQLRDVDRIFKRMMHLRDPTRMDGIRGHMLAKVGRGSALRGVKVPLFESAMGWEERFP